MDQGNAKSNKGSNCRQAKAEAITAGLTSG